MKQYIHCLIISGLILTISSSVFGQSGIQSDIYRDHISDYLGKSGGTNWLWAGLVSFVVITMILIRSYNDRKPKQKIVKTPIASKSIIKVQAQSVIYDRSARVQHYM